MVDPTKLPVPTVNRTFLKGLFWLILFLYLATHISFMRGIYDRLLTRPEVRKEVLTPTNDIILDDKVWIQRAIIFQNRGNGDAKNVYLQFVVPDGKITRLEIVSEEAYTLPITPTLNSGSASLSLERLAAGARVSVYLWASVSSSRSKADCLTSATFDGGIAESSDQPTALEEIRNIGSYVTRGLNRLGGRLQSLLMPTEAYAFFHSWFPIENQDFREITISILLLLFGSWVVLRRNWFAVMVAVLCGLFILLFADFWVNSSVLFILMALSVIPLVFTRSGTERVILIAGAALVWSMIIEHPCLEQLAASGQGSGWLSCVPHRIPGGIAVGYTLLVVYFVFTDKRRAR